MKRTVSFAVISRVFLLLCWCSVIPGFTALSHADDAFIDEVIVTNSSSDVLLYFTVKNAFVPDMEKGVQNGIPATFTFYVELYRNRKGWLDQQIVSASFNHTLSYENLKEEFHLELTEKNNKNVAVKSLAEAKKLMSEVNGYSVTSLGNLEPDKDYTLRVKARLEEKTLPMYVHHLIPFWSLWDFETDWHTVQFRY